MWKKKNTIHVIGYGDIMIIHLHKIPIFSLRFLCYDWIEKWNLIQMQCNELDSWRSWLAVNKEKLKFEDELMMKEFDRMRQMDALICSHHTKHCKASLQLIRCEQMSSGQWIKEEVDDERREKNMNFIITNARNWYIHLF